MANEKVSKDVLMYAKEFNYWMETANQFFDIAKTQIDKALASGEDDATIVEAIASAWHKCMSAQWTLFKSGKQTANRMALRRGVDMRQFHPAQLKNKEKGEMAKRVSKVLEETTEN